MKKVVPVKQEKASNFGQVGVRLIRKVMNNRHANGEAEQKMHHGRDRSPCRRGEWQDDRRQGKFNRRTMKLTEVFGEKDFKAFIEETMEMKCQDIIRLYAERNSVDLTQFKKNRNNNKMNKLSAFYDCPAEEFTEVV